MNRPSKSDTRKSVHRYLRDYTDRYSLAMSIKRFRFGTIFEPLIAFLIISLVTLWMLYPVSLNLNQLIYARPFDDAFEYIWYFGWFEEALFDLKISPLNQPNIFFPNGWNLNFVAFPPVYPFLLAPITHLLGPLVTNNLVVLVSTIFAAMGSYQLARMIGANMAGGLFAGLAYAFLPQREVYMSGHANFLIGSMWLPWIIVGFIKAGQAQNKKVIWMIFSGFAFAMSILGSWHFIFISPIIVLLFGLIYFLPLLRKEIKGWLAPIGAFSLVTLVMLGPLLVNAFTAREELKDSAVFKLSDANVTGVSLERFIVPSALNPLNWELARETFPLVNGQDAVVSFGYVVVILAVFALIDVRPWTTLTKTFVVLIATALLLMVGPFLNLWSTPIALPGPIAKFASQLLPTLVLENGTVGIPGPAFFIHRLVPYFRSFHHFGRYALIVAVGLAPLAGVGLSRISNRIKPKIAQAIVSIILIVLLLVEFNIQPIPIITSVDDMHRSVDDWLAARPEQSVIIEYPLDYAMKAQALYYTMFHKQKIVHGYSSVPPPSFTSMLPTLNLLPESEALDLLEELDVEYILVNHLPGRTELINDIIPTMRKSNRLELIGQFDDSIGPSKAIYLFRLVKKS
jgi:hypothetical protein